MRPPSLSRLVLLALAALGASKPIAAEPPDFKVIVNPNNPISAADREFVRDAYLKKASEWANHQVVHPIDLSARFPVRARFAERVIRKTPSQLRTYWNQQVFTGKNNPPPEVASVADAVAYVVATKGAIAYIPVDANPGAAKVIGIR